MIVLLIFAVVAFLTTIILIVSSLCGKQDFKSYIVFHGGQYAGEDEELYDTIVHEGMANEETYIISSGNLNDGNSSSKAYTFFLRNIDTNETFQCVVRDYLTIGKRGPNYPAQLQLEDASVSKLHCRIFVNGRELYVQDMESTNHTYYNGQILTNIAPLKNGVVLGIGSHGYEVRI